MPIRRKLLQLNDNMKIAFSFIIMMILLSNVSCYNKRKEDNSTPLVKQMLQQQGDALHFLDSIHYSRYYKESKWKIYLKYCDKKIITDEYGIKLNSPMLLGETDIYLISAHIERDTLLGLLFKPILLDSIPVNHSCFEDSSVKSSFYISHFYDIKHNRFYGYGFENTTLIDSTILNDYCNGVKDCNKKEFIEKNRNMLNKWFVEEAVRRKFIDE
jgi:hypothetical protein